MKLRLAYFLVAAAALQGVVAGYVAISQPSAQPADAAGEAPADTPYAPAPSTTGQAASAQAAPAQAAAAPSAPAQAAPAQAAPAQAAPIQAAPVQAAPQSTPTKAAPIPVATAPAARTAPSGNPLWGIPLKQLSFTQDRPIFSPSRRPPPPPPAAPAFVAPVVQRAPPKPREPEHPTISLVGTVAGASESIGVFLESSTRNVVRLRIGEDHQGWVLRSVKSREATLQKDTDTAVLELPPPGGGEPQMMVNSAPRNDLPPPRRQPQRR